jgi:hypothetical protein
MEVNTMEKIEINDVAGKKMVMEDMDYAKVKNKVIKPKKRDAGETGSELLSDEELRTQFSIVRKKTRKSTNDSVKQSSNKNQNMNKLQNHNQA